MTEEKTYGGFTLEDLMEYQKTEKAKAKAIKAAYADGTLTKPEKAKKVSERDPRILFLAEQLKVIIEENLEDIQALFAETIGDNKPCGQKGINVKMEGGFDVQLLNHKAFEHDRKKVKAAKEAEKALPEAPKPVEEI